MSATPNHRAMFEGGSFEKTTQFTNSTYAEADIVAANANDVQRVNTLMVSSTDTAIGYMNLFFKDGTNDYQFACVPIPVQSGTKSDGTVVPVNLLGHANLAGIVLSDAAGNPFIELPVGVAIRASMVAAPTSGKVFNILALGRNLAIAT